MIEMVVMHGDDRVTIVLPRSAKVFAFICSNCSKVHLGMRFSDTGEIFVVTPEHEEDIVKMLHDPITDHEARRRLYENQS